MRHSTKKRWTATLVVLIGLAWGADAFAQTVDHVTREIGEFPGELDELENRYLKPAMLASKYKLEARFNDAKVAYFMEDYQRAAILFVAVAQNEKFRRFESHREALYLLGDSLFQIHNHLAARRYFLELLELGPGSFYEEAAARLLEIAYLSNRFEDVDAIYARLEGSGTVSAALNYLSGKAFYEQKKYEEAQRSFAKAASDPQYANVANYFRGVALVAQKELDQARPLFEALVREPRIENERDREVVHLAYMALGRLAYEQGDIEAAIDYYGHLPRTSKHFDRALWEMTWVLLSKKRYEAARRNVDILLLADPSPSLIADAKLLRADLSLKLENYDEAREDYEDVLDTFTPVKEEMEQFAARHEDLPAFFATLVQEELRGAEPQYLPPLVSKWVETDPQMRAASRILGQVRTVDTDIRDSFRMLSEISARLDSSTRIQSFPDLADGMSRGVAAESRILELRQRLLDLEYEIVSPHLSEQARQQWASHQADLTDFQKRFRDMPKDREELATRERQLSQEYDRLRRRLDRVSYDIDSQKAQLAAVDTYIANEYGRPLSEKEKAKVSAMRAELKGTIEELETLHGELLHELELSRQQVGMGDVVMQAESQVRRRYRQHLDEAHGFLEQFHPQVSGADRATLERISSARAAIPRLEARLNGYFERMNALVDDKVAELREDLRVEYDLVESHQQSIEQIVNESQAGAGVLAYLNFMRARSQFNEVVLRGDVGIIDVVWAKKEDMTSKINQLFEDRTTELRLLQEAFQEVR